MIAVVYMGQESHAQALRSAEQMRTLSKESGDLQELARALRLQGTVHLHSSNAEEGLGPANEALATLRKAQGSMRQEADMLLFVSQVQITAAAKRAQSSHDVAGVMAKSGDKALKSANEAHNLAKKLGDE